MSGAKLGTKLLMRDAVVSMFDFLSKKAIVYCLSIKAIVAQQLIQTQRFADHYYRSVTQTVVKQDFPLNLTMA